MGRRSLDVESEKQQPPRFTPATLLPSHGQPLLVQRYRPRENTGRAPSKAKARLTPRAHTPPRANGPSVTIPEVPPISQNTESKDGASSPARNSRSPTPSHMSLTENERPPSRDAATVAGSPPMQYESMRRYPDAVQNLALLPAGYLHLGPAPAPPDQPFAKQSTASARQITPPKLGGIVSASTKNGRPKRAIY